MKRIILFTGMFLIINCIFNIKLNAEVNNKANEDLNLITTKNLDELTNSLVSKYTKDNPNTNIIVSEKDANDININNNIGIISDASSYTTDDENILKLVIGRNIIVPVINSNNPFLDEIYTQGINSEKLKDLFQGNANLKWNRLFNNVQNKPVKVYLTGDQVINNVLIDYLGINKSNLNNFQVESSDKILSNIQNNKYALGFCKLSDIIENQSQEIVKGLKILPIDKNNNGKIDFMENIYENLATFTRGVWIGKYPKQLYQNIYAVSNITSINEKEIDFMKWIVTNGQAIITTNGFDELIVSEANSNINKINTINNPIITEPKNDNNFPNKAFYILLVVIVLLFVTDRIFRFRKKPETIHVETKTQEQYIFDENNISFPKGLFFDKTYTWTFMEKDGIVKIGADDFLQHIAGSISQVKMKNVGDHISMGEHLFTIVQNGKQLNINSPVSGNITERNEALTQKGSIINESPYSEGWIYKVEPSNWLNEIQLLSLGDQYKEWIGNEFIRLKDFLANISQSDKIDSPIIMQDGGSIKDGILSALGPKIWEDFQINFIDNSNQQ